MSQSYRTPFVFPDVSFPPEVLLAWHFYFVWNLASSVACRGRPEMQQASPSSHYSGPVPFSARVTWWLGCVLALFRPQSCSVDRKGGYLALPILFSLHTSLVNRVFIKNVVNMLGNYVENAYKPLSSSILRSPFADITDSSKALAIVPGANTQTPIYIL